MFIGMWWHSSDMVKPNIIYNVFDINDLDIWYLEHGNGHIGKAPTSSRYSVRDNISIYTPPQAGIQLRGAHIILEIIQLFMFDIYFSNKSMHLSYD